MSTTTSTGSLPIRPPLSGTYSYIYDLDRRLVQTILPSGSTATNTYSQGRLVQIQTPEDTIDLTYSCGSKVESIGNSTDTIYYDYDGKLITGQTLAGTLNQTLSYAYNNDFAVTDFTYAGATESFSYDLDGLLTNAGDYTIYRNADTSLPETLSSSQLLLSRSFNGYGETASENTTVNGEGLFYWGVTRDDSGKILTKTETVAGNTSEYAYAYDSLGRLLTVNKDGTTVEEYQYDDIGNRTWERNDLRGITSRSFSYSDEDQVISSDTASYQFDLDGFLTSKIDDEGTTSYTYSARGELLQMNLADGTQIDYTYDPLGRRVAKSVNGSVEEKYLWQGATTLLAVYDGSDNLLMRFTYAEGRMPLTMTSNGSTYYLVSLVT